MNRNLGVKPEFLKEDKESIRANLNEYINRCLIEWQDLNLYELEKKDNVNKQEVEYILLENIGAIDV